MLGVPSFVFFINKERGHILIDVFIRIANKNSKEKNTADMLIILLIYKSNIVV